MYFFKALCNTKHSEWKDNPLTHWVYIKIGLKNIEDDTYHNNNNIEGYKPIGEYIKIVSLLSAG